MLRGTCSKSTVANRNFQFENAATRDAMFSNTKPANASVAWPYADKDLLTTAEEMRSLSWQNRTRTSEPRGQTQQQQSQNLVSRQLHPPLTLCRESQSNDLPCGRLQHRCCHLHEHPP